MQEAQKKPSLSKSEWDYNSFVMIQKRKRKEERKAAIFGFAGIVLIVLFSMLLSDIGNLKPFDNAVEIISFAIFFTFLSTLFLYDYFNKNQKDDQ